MGRSIELLVGAACSVLAALWIVFRLRTANEVGLTEPEWREAVRSAAGDGEWTVEWEAVSEAFPYGVAVLDHRATRRRKTIRLTQRYDTVESRRAEIRRQLEN